MSDADDLLSGGDRLLTTKEVAVLFRVEPNTVGRWARAGRLGTPIKTAGGHRRYRESEVRAFLTREEVTGDGHHS